MFASLQSSGSVRLVQCSLRLATKSSSNGSMSIVGQQLVACHSTWSRGTTRKSRSLVDPSLRQRRPIVNGEAIAFHVNDLDFLPQHQQQPELRKMPAPFLSSSPARAYESDLIVVLDMDECLIHSTFLSTPGAKYAHQLLQQQQPHQNDSNNNNATTATEKVDSFRVTLPDGDLVHVNKRPFLDDFLRQVTSRFETHVFTAAMEVYAKPVLDTLDPTGTMFARRWYRETCTFDRGLGVYVKNLNKLLPSNEQHRRVVLVDNNPFSFLANPSNGILVSSFYNDPKDNTLPAVLDLLDELHDHDDVRPLLNERFGLRDALQQYQTSQNFSYSLKASSVSWQ